MIPIKMQFLQQTQKNIEARILNYPIGRGSYENKNMMEIDLEAIKKEIRLGNVERRMDALHYIANLENAVENLRKQVAGHDYNSDFFNLDHKEKVELYLKMLMTELIYKNQKL